MFVTSAQIYVFISWVAYGVVAGLVLVVNEIIKPFIKFKLLKILIDVFAFVFLSVGYVYYSYKLSFPNYRAYMFFGVIIGVFLSNKSFYLILAKLVKNIYNIYVSTKRKKQNARKRI